MNKKLLVYILAGIAVAALICIITGIIMYSVAIGKQISVTAPDYSLLIDQKKSAVAIGMLMVIVGCTFIALPVAGFIYLLVSHLIEKRRSAKIAQADNIAVGDGAADKNTEKEITDK